MKILYVFPKYPKKSEAFSSPEIINLSKKNQLEVVSLRKPDKNYKKLLNERNLSNQKIYFPSYWFSLLSIFIFIKNYKKYKECSKFIFSENTYNPLYYLKSFFYLFLSIDLCRRIKLDDVSLIHFFWGHYPVIFGVIARIEGFNGSFSQFLGAYDLISNLKISVIFANTYADILLTHSYSNVHDLVNYGIREDKIHVIHRGIQTSYLTDVQDVRGHVEEKDYNLIIAAGRLIPGKGLDQCILAMKSILTRYPQANLLIFGDGNDRYKLERLAVSNKIDGQVTFMGHRSQSEFHEFLKKAGFFFHFSNTESERLPNVVKEAMYHGCICIVSFSKGIDELIENGVTGIIINPPSIDKIAMAFQNLQNDSSSLRSMSIAAKEKIMLDFDAYKSVSALFSIWSKIVKNNKL